MIPKPGIDSAPVSGTGNEAQEDHPVLADPINLKSIRRVDKWLPEFLRHQRGLPGKFRRLSLPLLAEAIRKKNVFWPRLIARYIRGRDVLDVGCGRSLYGVGFLFAGAKSYTGVDPVADLQSNVLKDSSSLHGRFKESAFTLAEVSRRLPDVAYVSGTTSDLPKGADFDVLALHNVTEHLMDIEKSIEEFLPLIRSGGRIAFRHPNYYSWGGHHMKPRTTGEIISGDPEQAKYMDWEHLVPRKDWPGKITKKQNRIRLGEFRELVERFFHVELWQAQRSLPKEGVERMTPEILEKHPDFSEEEMLTQCVICIARKK